MMFLLFIRSIIKHLNVDGDSYKTIKLGVDQIRGVCPMNVSSNSLLVVTKQNKVELRRATSGRLVHRLETGDFDPCAICPSGSETVLVSSWSLNSHSSIVELQVSCIRYFSAGKIIKHLSLRRPPRSDSLLRHVRVIYF